MQHDILIRRLRISEIANSLQTKFQLSASRKVKFNDQMCKLNRVARRQFQARYTTNEEGDKGKLHVLVKFRMTDKATKQFKIIQLTSPVK